MPTGKVKWFNVAKGFGFIIPHEGGADVYLPLKSVEAAKLPRLETGVTLNYALAESRGRKFADSLSIVSSVAVETSPGKAKGEDVQKSLDTDDEFERERGLRPV
ncbi:MULTISPECIES: cold shock domain-containing protein [Rhizobium]|uniref:Cold shock domain-containing protein n=1 Tax=Rhizobium rhododendri TaxID=2506430 RepID=A0ABY8IRY6_9HYPH|nr:MULTISPECIES: cold shock domain-containing protein [Rhizobium]TQX84340.1 cold shock domain-containing protein [Rhizobium sp. rho-13.1]TQY04755.1 cold shock domain-containing protein [Rhizobium sp. rho-1.1]WFS26250.1 cold shock domain-containing protein [Rhizobium rhododendri]